MKIVIAGGGTGGHIYPAVAIAQAFERRDETNDIVFVGSRYGMEAELIPKENYPIRLLSVRGFRGKGVFGFIRAALLLPIAVIKSLFLLREERPDLVIGVGGYASVPVGICAGLLGYPLVLEEQNVVPGWANRYLACLSRRIFLSFDEARQYFPSRPVEVTGLPIREDFLNLIEPKKASVEKLRILVTGASQGARGLNQKFLRAIKENQQLADQIEIIHQTGEHDLDAVRAAYEELGIDARVDAFLYPFAKYLNWADLVIARGGAGTVWEIAAAATAAIFIPYPHHKDQHQQKNVRFLVEANAAFVFDESESTDEAFQNQLNKLIQDRKQIERMSKAAGSESRINAADRIVDECYRIVE